MESSFALEEMLMTRSVNYPNVFISKLLLTGGTVVEHLQNIT